MSMLIKSLPPSLPEYYGRIVTCLPRFRGRPPAGITATGCCECLSHQICYSRSRQASENESRPALQPNQRWRDQAA